MCELGEFVSLKLGNKKTRIKITIRAFFPLGSPYVLSRFEDKGK